METKMSQTSIFAFPIAVIWVAGIGEASAQAVAGVADPTGIVE
jgi:hypothetical protein